MAKHRKNESWSHSEFRAWLVASGVSDRVAGNYISRCRRIESNLKINLCSEVETEESFKSLMLEIQKYADSNSKTLGAAYTLTGSLRLSARKFAEFWLGKKAEKFPMCHGTSKYMASSPVWANKSLKVAP